MGKLRVYFLGFTTLLMLPSAWLLMQCVHLGWDALINLPLSINIALIAQTDYLPFTEFLHLESLFTSWTLIGAEFGLLYGALMLIFMSGETARLDFYEQIEIVQSLKLTIIDALFLSLCAGLGEEFLFRIALQEYFHPLLVAVFFVAIHGYILPMNWDKTRYGIAILLFIIVLSYAVDVQGIWFCVAAHAAYDLILFVYWSRQRSLN